jgi:hypothetical protein
MASDGVRRAVRAADSDEANRLTNAARNGPYIAWRDGRRLEIHALATRTPATIGRTEGSILIGHPQVSREHAEVTVRVHGVPLATSVYLLDYSKHGTEHRRVTLDAHGVARADGPWLKAPVSPARPCQLDAGFHDVRLAGEMCVLIGGVPIDDGRTADRDDSVIPPTARQRAVLVELCRPFFEAPKAANAPPSNKQIALDVNPPMTAERVRNHLSDLYERYELHDTGQRVRVALVNFAIEHGLVDATDYV